MGILESSDMINWFLFLERSTLMLKNGLIYFSAAGAKFGGQVAEHHDGVAMWDSKITPWNVALMGPKRDVLGEYSRELKKHGMKVMTTFHHARLLQRYKNTERPDRPEFWDLYDSHFPYSEEMPTSSNNRCFVYFMGT